MKNTRVIQNLFTSYPFRIVRPAVPTVSAHPVISSSAFSSFTFLDAQRWIRTQSAQILGPSEQPSQNGMICPEPFQKRQSFPSTDSHVPVPIFKVILLNPNDFFKRFDMGHWLNRFTEWNVITHFRRSISWSCNLSINNSLIPACLKLLAEGMASSWLTWPFESHRSNLMNARPLDK